MLRWRQFEALRDSITILALASVVPLPFTNGGGNINAVLRPIALGGCFLRNLPKADELSRRRIEDGTC